MVTANERKMPSIKLPQVTFIGVSKCDFFLAQIRLALPTNAKGNAHVECIEIVQHISNIPPPLHKCAKMDH